MLPLDFRNWGVGLQLKTQGTHLAAKPLTRSTDGAQRRRKIMPERFTDALRAANELAWSNAVGHRFVKELCAGTVPDAVMARYLVQDHRFLDSFLTLLGAALASADTFSAKLS